MTNSTCKVWGCSRSVYDHKYTKYCKQHSERTHHNGHPTFKPPALARQYDSYNQELTMAFHGGKRWYKEADLEHFEQAFNRLLDEAEQLPALSQYRRLGDLPYRKQLLYLLKSSVERVGRQDIMKQWLCLYLAANFKRDLFPNRKTLAVFVFRKCLRGRTARPQHITKSGKKKQYLLNAKRALKMLRILEPIFDLAFACANNQALWFRYYFFYLNSSNLGRKRMEKFQENNPDHAKTMARIRLIKSINRKYLGG